MYLGLACTCCALAQTNGDTSACEDTHFHENVAEFGVSPAEGAVVIGDLDHEFIAFRCCGCGDDVIGSGYIVTLE